MPGGVIVSDSGLCYCGPAFSVWRQLFERNNYFPLYVDSIVYIGPILSITPLTIIVSVVVVVMISFLSSRGGVLAADAEIKDPPSWWEPRPIKGSLFLTKVHVTREAKSTKSKQ